LVYSNNMIYNSQKYQNNFDFLRLLASLLVIVNHCYPLLVNNPPYDFLQTFTGYMGTGTLSLNIFFIISGYLITQSFVEKPKVISFLIARFLRIVPAVIPLLVIVIIVAAFVSLLKPFNYFLNLETLQFLCNFNLFKIQFSLPGVFTESFFKTNSIVGSLWSLGYEVLMYFIFLIVAYFAVLRHKLAYLCFCGVSILVCMLIDNNNIELNIPFTSYQI
jgi:peptidoglycan/LPS O-acetylase OafA/YrhL